MTIRIKRLNVPFELKEIDETGTFSGYASVFGVIDGYRERVMPGAFKGSLKEWAKRKILPPLLWNHNSDTPIGPHTKIEEDDVGLYIEGRLLVGDVVKATETHALLKARAVSGISIGYSTIKSRRNTDDGVIELQELKLWENSIVTFPANEAARVEDVKSSIMSGELPDLKDFESFLREVGGFSKTQAAAIVCKGYAELYRSESGDPAAEALRILQS